jgi:hypothetical protein
VCRVSWERAIACLKIANALNPNDREVLVNLGISQVNELSGAKVDPPRFTLSYLIPVLPFPLTRTQL